VYESWIFHFATRFAKTSSFSSFSWKTKSVQMEISLLQIVERIRNAVCKGSITVLINCCTISYPNRKILEVEGVLTCHIFLMITIPVILTGHMLRLGVLAQW
jgi:hypothetical protein